MCICITGICAHARMHHQFIHVQDKDSDEGAKKLSKMLEEQRDSLERQARVSV